MSASSAISREVVLEKLGEILDPCSVQAHRAMDIVTMGLVGDLRIEGSSVFLSLVLTEPVCWFSRDLMNFATDKIQGIEGVRHVEVSLDRETIWTPDRITQMPPYQGPIPITFIAKARPSHQVE